VKASSISAGYIDLRRRWQPSPRRIT